MKRRKFIKNLSISGGAGMMLSGIPVNLLAGNSKLKAIAAASTNNNVLVFIQLHGGNDALNTLIPLGQYDEYYALRENIALNDTGTRKIVDLDPGLPDEKRVGLHPDMLDMKTMYDEGMLSVIQNVGYDNINRSHFRGRDIMFMGVDGSGQTEPSGWMGRFLDHLYPNYPEENKGPGDDPIGLEFSGVQSLAFHQESGIPMGFNINNPAQFYNLINGLDLENLEDINGIQFPNTHAGEELKYLMDFETTSDFYSERLKEAYEKGGNPGVSYRKEYPYGSGTNPLSDQLRIIAQLLGGGLQTRIFLCRIGGFDTHEAQVDPNNTSLGVHSRLMHFLSTAMKDFYDDLGSRGIANRVLSTTFTEFGRKAKSNDSFGTDHGTTSPVFLFGPGLNGGVMNNSPDLTLALQTNDLQYTDDDYRYIYGSVVKDWFGADDETVEKAFFDTKYGTDRYGLFNPTSTEEVQRDILKGKLSIYPNPARERTHVSFFIRKYGHYRVVVYNTLGQVLHTIENTGSYGLNEVTIQLNHLPKGVYTIVTYENNNKQSGKLIVE
ncbi:MAG: DUF1501 domain-containing protein [Bacteroidetes bacterium]|jgi:uncharacterized protein (DUF1501 family)|nr:DUF1501 domain-containing protein [Bacteroidota bacterium]